MILKLFSFLLVLFVSYTLVVFFAPEVADMYGDADVNAKIRNFKEQILSFSSGATDATSLYDKIKMTWEGYLQNTQETYSGIESKAREIQLTLSGKVEDVKEAVDSVQKAYDAIEEAKKDLNKALNFSGTNQSTSISGTVNTSQNISW